MSRALSATFADWMIFVGFLLPYLTVVMAKLAGGGYDNNAPRAYLEGLTGWQRRADWAHRNHFEAFAPFAAAVLLAERAGAVQATVNILAGIFILARIGYTMAYLGDKATLRSALWGLGFVAVIALFFKAS